MRRSRRWVGGGALGLREDARDGRGGGEAMDLEAGGGEDGHGGEGLQLVGVGLEEDLGRGLAAGGLDRGFIAGLAAGFAAGLAAGLGAGEEEAGGHALEVPLEGRAEGLVEVVNVEDEAVVETGVGAEIFDVGRRRRSG